MKKKLYAFAAAVVVAGGLWWAFRPQVESHSTGHRDAKISGAAPSPLAARRYSAGQREAIGGMPLVAASKASRAPDATVFDPLPPVNTPMRIAYSQLKRQADAGDPEAQCRLAFELQRCRALPQKMRDAEELARQPHGPHADAMKALLSVMRRRIATDGPVCRDFKPDSNDEPWRYTLQAAIGGNDVAALSFVFGMSAGLNPGRPVATLDGWEAYQQYAPRLLQRAIDDGNPGAYYMAANFTRSAPFGATLVANDPVQAAAYYLALMPSASPSFRDDLQRGVQHLNLSEADVTEAQLRAAPLTAKLRVTSGGGLDLSTGILNEGRAPDGSECSK